MQGKILTPTKRIRRTPFSSKIEDQVKGVTVYNHMILPTIFKDAEEDCRHLKSEVQVWDVSVQRQVEIVGKEAATQPLFLQFQLVFGRIHPILCLLYTSPSPRD